LAKIKIPPYWVRVFGGVWTFRRLPDLLFMYGWTKCTIWAKMTKMCPWMKNALGWGCPYGWIFGSGPSPPPSDFFLTVLQRGGVHQMTLCFAFTPSRVNAGRHGEGDPVLSLFLGLCGHPGALVSSPELSCGKMSHSGQGPDFLFRTGRYQSE
jgi:hypothetical protein